VAHLDLKSSNVLLASDGTAKIADVGLAALISRSYLSQMAPAGTWAWVAPEVILGGAHAPERSLHCMMIFRTVRCMHHLAWRACFA
jgi:serine/threonine protein kinase